MRRLVAPLALCCVPTALLSAMELQPMHLEPSQPPPVQAGAGDRLVDAVVPAYGVRSQAAYRMPSRMRSLYAMVMNYTGWLEAEVSRGALGQADDQYQVLTTGSGRPLSGARPVLIRAEVLPEQQALVDLLAQVDAFADTTPLPNHYERWQINNSYRSIYRAANVLALGIGDSRFANLRSLHRGWKDYYHRLVQAAIVARAAEILAEQDRVHAEARRLPRPRLEAALQEALGAGERVPWPAMSLDLEEDPYPAVLLPAIPRWSDVAERERERFIQVYGVPGQALLAYYPEPDPELAQLAEDPDFKDAPVTEEELEAAEDPQLDPALPEDEPTTEPLLPEDTEAMPALDPIDDAVDLPEQDPIDDAAERIPEPDHQEPDVDAAVTREDAATVESLPEVELGALPAVDAPMQVEAVEDDEVPLRSQPAGRRGPLRGYPVGFVAQASLPARAADQQESVQEELREPEAEEPEAPPQAPEEQAEPATPAQPVEEAMPPVVEEHEEEEEVMVDEAGPSPSAEEPPPPEEFFDDLPPLDLE